MYIPFISALTSNIARSARRPRLTALLPCVALAAFSCIVSFSQTSSAPPIQSSASIWFHPQPAFIEPQANGLPDFLPLFQSDAPWPRAMAKTKVFGLYAGFITAASPQVLHQVVDFISAHEMTIEIEAPSLQAKPNCGSGVEGYVPYGQSLEKFTLSYLQRLKSFGAQHIVVKVDEPYYFGVVVNDPHACHFSVQQTAEYVGHYAQLVKSVYPDAEIGDVEPIIDSAYPPGVVKAMSEWHQAYREATGENFPFFFADIEFGNQTWPYLVQQLEQQTHQLGMHFGIIYIGDQADLTDAEWAAKTISRFYVYQGDSGGRPDYVLFQSWEPHPQYFLPESNPFTFTGVLDAYIDATSPHETRLEECRDGADSPGKACNQRVSTTQPLPAGDLKRYRGRPGDPGGWRLSPMGTGGITRGCPQLTARLRPTNKLRCGRMRRSGISGQITSQKLLL